MSYTRTTLVFYQTVATIFVPVQIIHVLELNDLLIELNILRTMFTFPPHHVISVKV